MSAAAPVGQGVAGLRLQLCGGSRARWRQPCVLPASKRQALLDRKTLISTNACFFLPGILINVIVYYFPVIFLCLKITIFFSKAS